MLSLLTANSEWISVVQSLGFPIVMCVAMGYYVKYTYDKFREDRNALNEAHWKQIDSLTKQHEEEMSKITEALNNNTIALNKLAGRLGEDKQIDEDT